MGKVTVVFYELLDTQINQTTIIVHPKIPIIVHLEVLSHPVKVVWWQSITVVHVVVVVVL